MQQVGVPLDLVHCYGLTASDERIGVPARYLGGAAAGYVRGITGSYDPAWWAGIELMTCAAILTVLTPAPKKPDSRVDYVPTKSIRSP